VNRSHWGNDKTTNFANSHGYDIYVRVGARQNEGGWAKITPGNYLGFSPEPSGSNLYATIIGYNGRNWVYFTINFPVCVDHSLVVGVDGMVHRVQYGRIWRAEDGTYPG
jgi:hypothetical protein